MSNEVVKLNPPDILLEEIKSLLEEEETILGQTFQSLEQQQVAIRDRFNKERQRSRELTSSMIATQRVEDRRQLSSDEAVSHALTTQHDESLAILEALRERPYFARVVLDEEDEKGGHRRMEYKIGYKANPACRIIDWRHAPLSKLYYEHKEGDEYCEEIQGRERFGKVLLRNRVEIQKGILRQVSCRYGTFYSTENGWKGTQAVIGSNRDFSSLPDVLSLISPEQFLAITKNASSAVLIQGIAGSGKTTVALHRLSWLLEKGNSDLTPTDALVLTLGPSLREYIRSSLGSLGITTVPVFSYRDWCGPLIGPYLPASLRKGPKGAPELLSGANRAGMEIERVKRSMGLLRALEKTAEINPDITQPLELLISTLKNSKLITELDETKFLDKELIQAALDRTREIEKRGALDRSDFSLLLRCLQLTQGPLKVSGRSELYQHIIIDEVQDYSPVELATVLSSVTNVGNLTLVGDTAQRLEEGFPGWEKLRRWWTARKIESSFIRLEVSHRSTKAIVECASALGGLPAPAAGRRGVRPQVLFAAAHETLLGGMLGWLQRGVAASPNALIGVLCFSAAHVKELHALLSPTFGPIVRTGDESSFSFAEGIVVCEVFAAKGLEFHSVLVYQPTGSVLPAGDTGKHLLYIASTRAQEKLAFAVFGNQKSPVMGLPERILERVDLDDVEKEESLESDE